MTLVELQDVLGRRIEIAENPDMDIAQRKEETEISQTIASLAKQMIKNADIALEQGRRAVAAELKPGYFTQMVRNCEEVCNPKDEDQVTFGEVV